jgi:phosphatidylinositol alpha-mannosyltransferase
VPVVAADNSAIAENLRGAAKLVPAGDRNMLAGAIARALRDEGLRRALRSAGLARVARFHWEQMGREIVSTYRELTSASPPRLARAST